MQATLSISLVKSRCRPASRLAVFRDAAGNSYRQWHTTGPIRLLAGKSAGTKQKYASATRQLELLPGGRPTRGLLVIAAISLVTPLNFEEWRSRTEIHMRRREFLKSVPPVVLIPQVRSAPALKITQIRIINLKVVRETEKMEGHRARITLAAPSRARWQRRGAREPNRPIEQPGPALRKRP